MGASVGVIGTLASSNALQLVQGWHYGSRSEKFTKLSYELDFQGLRLDVLSTIREEIRDQVFVIMSKLDNLMVVSTLMLSIGFGFVVEGTFPPEKAEELGNWEIKSLGISVDPLAVYSFLCAMSLCMPFWCLSFTIRMRYEVETIVSGHMGELRRQLSNVLQKKQMTDPEAMCTCPKPSTSDENFCRNCGGKPDKAAPSDPSGEDNMDRQMPRPYEADVRIGIGRRFSNLVPQFLRRRKEEIRCPRRLKEATADMRCPLRNVPESVKHAPQYIENVVDQVATHVGPYSIGNEPLAIEQNQILKWAEMDLMHRMKTYTFYLKVAHSLLWLGMLSAIFCCSLLLGVYMMENFPNTPWMWRAYTYPVGITGVLGVVFALWMVIKGQGPVKANCQSPAFRDNSFEKVYSLPSSLMEPMLGRRSSSQRFGGQADPYSPRGSRRPSFDNREFDVRVKEAYSRNNSYKRVLLPADKDGRPTNLKEVHRKIREKFRKAAEVAGSGNTQGHASVEWLVRESDRLEICDDSDLSVLKYGDKLEVTFGLFRRHTSDASNTDAPP